MLLQPVAAVAAVCDRRLASEYELRMLLQSFQGFGREAFVFVGEKFFTDFRPFGPCPEFLFSLLRVVGLIENEPLGLERNPVGFKIATAEAVNGGGKFAQS